MPNSLAGTEHPVRAGSILCRPAAAKKEAAIPIKVVIVTMFEVGEDSGDRPGEFQTWVEQLPLPGENPVRLRFPRPPLQPR
jgi:purine nucleoside permease